MSELDTNSPQQVPNDEISQAFFSIAETMVYIKDITEGGHSVSTGEIHRLYQKLGTIEKLAEHAGAVADNMAKRMDGAQWRGGLESWAMPYLTQDLEQ